LTRTSKAITALIVVLLIGFVAWRGFDPIASPTVSDRVISQISPGGELTASLRADVPTYNRYTPAGANLATEILSLLVHARLVRVNRSTDQVEAMLAESWTTSADGLAYTLKLRRDVTFSDGAPFTAKDVLFSFRVVYDPAVKSPVRTSVQVGGKPIEVSAPDPHTVVLKFPEPFAPGLRLLDNLPILPSHKLESALASGQFAQAWLPSGPTSDLVGLGPFVLSEHVSGQRLVFSRNPRYFRRDAQGRQLPYLDRLTLSIVPDQTTETLRLDGGETDLMSVGELRPQDYASVKRRADQGALQLLDVGVGLDPDFLSFNLRPAKAADPRASWLLRKEFRQAIAWGVDRQAIVDTVYLGAAVPVSGPVTPGNKTWFSAATPVYTHNPGRARGLLTSIGLRDANGDGMLEDQKGQPVRFAILTQAGHNRERAATVVQSQLKSLGIAADIVGLDPPGIAQRFSVGDYDAMYFGITASSTDPWVSPEFWLSSGSFHLWNPGQERPATEWEARIDALMRDNAGAPLEQRQRAFAEIQRLFAEEVPSLYFVAPRLILAASPRVLNATPAPQTPQILWNAESLAARQR
jgi:peptide/nickel transport system substrate-binding protein